MQVKVAYLSRKGNTKKVAQAIAKELEVTALPLASALGHEPVDLLFVGGPIHGGKIDEALRQFVGELNPALVKRVAVFGTSATGMTSEKEMRALLEAKKIPLLGVYFCKGAFLMANRGRPDEQDLGKAAQFAANLAHQVKLEIVDGGKESM